MGLLLPLLLVLALLPSISGFQYARCFQKLERHSVDNSQPLTEVFRTSPLDCLEQCITHTGNGEEQNEPGLCRAVVYDHLQHSCRLFGHDGRKIPAVVHPANGFDLYRRTASSQECAGPVKRLQAVQAKKSLFAAPSQANPEGKAPILPVPEGGDSPLADQELATLLDQLGGEEVQLTASGNADAKQQSAGTLLNCASQGRPSGFLTFLGGKRDEDGTDEFLGWTQKQCADFCAENEGPDAETYECAGFSHVPGGGRCRLHRRLAQGELSLQSIGGGAYGEKWCIPAHRFGMCREGTLFPVHLQRRFQPNCIPLATIEGVQTLVDCLQKCMDQRGCQSISFYAPSQRCLLHRESPLPGFIEPADQGWTLAENGCADRKGPVGMVDNEEGELARDAIVPEGPSNGKAYGQANVECGEGRLSEFLLGQKRRK